MGGLRLKKTWTWLRYSSYSSHIMYLFAYIALTQTGSMGVRKNTVLKQKYLRIHFHLQELRFLCLKKFIMNSADAVK